MINLDKTIESRILNPIELTKMPSNNSFGYFFTTIFTLIAIYSYWQQFNYFAVVAIASSITFLATTVFAPQLLSPLNLLWYKLGILLGNVISPIVLGVIFFILITPIALITRLFGHDELKIKKVSVQSYWVNRSPPGPPADSFNNQF